MTWKCKEENLIVSCHLLDYIILLQKKPSFNSRQKGVDLSQAFITKTHMIELVICLQKLFKEGEKGNRDQKIYVCVF